ncbi:MAG: hypothetical protein ACLP3K_06470 [Candidatus Acidiferrales bacterium]
MDANSQDYLRFVTAQGMRIVEGKSSYWIEKRSRFWESAPAHRRVHLPEDEAAMLFRLGAIAIRYTCNEDQGTPTCQYIWDDKNFSLESLHKDARRNVRKNIGVCKFKPIDFEFLAREGCAINRDVFSRQDRDEEEFQTDKTKWMAYMKVCQSMPFVEAYGVFIEDRLCAYSLVLFVDDYCYTLHPYARAEFFKFYPMNVLIYLLVKTVLERPSVRCVSYGMQSYTSRPTLERFKIAMGCRKDSLGMRIVVHPLARPLFSAPGAWVTERALRLLKPRMGSQFAVFSQAVRNQPKVSSVQESDGRLNRMRSEQTFHER